MNTEIVLVLGVVAATLALFLHGRLRVDLVALLVVLALVLLRLVSPSEAVAGFSNPVVITIGAVFVLSAGLYRTGVASVLARQILRVGGTSEGRLLLAIMVAVAVMSFFMNTVGIVALMLPAVMDIARRTGRAPSRLLMPLSFGALLGGLTTLFATLTNLLASNALRDHGFKPFGIFDFIPVGATAAGAGILFLAWVGRRLLPTRDLQKESSTQARLDLKTSYDLHERMFVLRLPPASVLTGKSLADSRLGSALGLHVVAVLRDGETLLAPGPDHLLQGGDQLLVQGTPDQLQALDEWRQLVLGEGLAELDQWFPAETAFAEATIPDKSLFIEQTLPWIDLRRRCNVNVLAIRRGPLVRRSRLQDFRLEAGDILLVHGLRPQLESLKSLGGLAEFRFVARDEVAEMYRLEERLFTLEVPAGSHLVDRTLEQSRLGEALGLSVLSIVRHGKSIFMPAAREKIQVGDQLLAAGRTEDLLLLRGLKQLELEREVLPDLSEFESDKLGMMEAVLSPRTSLTGKSIRQLQFRDRYSLTVLGLWRAGAAHTTRLRDVPLQFGDALLLYRTA